MGQHIRPEFTKLNVEAGASDLVAPRRKLDSTLRGRTLFRELLARESRLPPIIGVGLAAVLMGSVAVATAQASLPTREERASAASAPEPAPEMDEAVAAHRAMPKYFFISPLAGHAVNSPFGMRKMPWEEGGRLHEGVDIAAPAGTPVRATTAGVIVRSGVDGGYGRFVEIRHANGMTSLYAHLGRLAGLKKGAYVKAGAIVGHVGSSGRSTGSHLHFEIRHLGRPLNPTAFMGRVFQTEADLPLTEAARVSRRVRVAQVSNWPTEILARRKAREAAAGTVSVADAGRGRVRAVIQPGGAGAAAAPAPAPAPAAPHAPSASAATDAATAAAAHEAISTAN